MAIQYSCPPKQWFSYYTSVCSCASTTGCPRDCEVVIWSNRFGESNWILSFDFNVEVFAFQGDQCVILAFPLLEVRFVITVVEAHFAPHTFALRSQALFGRDSEKPITGRPADVKATVIFFQQAKPSGLVGEGELVICGEYTLIKLNKICYITCIGLYAICISNLPCNKSKKDF